MSVIVTNYHRDYGAVQGVRLEFGVDGGVGRYRQFDRAISWSRHQAEIYPAFSLTVYNRTFQCMKPPLIGPFNAWKPTILDIKNQRGARNRVHFCDELVLYGIRLLT